MDKLRIGIFKFTSCAGCQFQFLYFQEHLLEVLEAVELVYFMMGKSGGLEEGPFDIALIDGAITSSEQVDQVKRIRGNSRLLVPMGACAVDGGIPSIKNRTPELEIQKRVYRDTSLIHSIKAHPVDAYVKVDAYLRGCPISEMELLELFSATLSGRRPVFKRYSVCVDCKLQGNTCLLVAKGEMCMGPVTVAGCWPLCPSNGRICYGCRGPMDDANAISLAQTFEEGGLTRDDIVRKFSQFAGLTLAFRKGAEPYE